MNFFLFNNILKDNILSQKALADYLAAILRDNVVVKF